MPVVTRSTVIDAPIEAVWAVLRDFNGHDGWHPAVAESRLENGRPTDAVGAVRAFSLTGGERLRERLIALSDKDYSLRYCIEASEVPLLDYVAEIRLKPVTDGGGTFWSWRSTFRTPPGRERELARMVGDGVYEAGFEAIRAKLAQAAPVKLPGAMEKAAGSIEGQGIAMTAFGGPEVLRPCPVHAPPPGPGEVRLRQTAIGVNYIDVYCRSGYFKLAEPPAILGMEAAGIVIDTGPGVPHLKPGQRVAYACPPVGSYADIRTMAADLVVPVPDGIDDRVAAAALLKGVTAEFLLHRVHAVKRGDIVLVYAPAGGVGRLICQWAAHLGATVIGATSSPEKARVAREAGCRHVVLPGPRSLEEQVMDITRGHGADVIYDAVGRDSYAHSIAALATCGHLVSFGQASGDIGARDISALASKSVTLSRPNYGHYTDTPEKIRASAARLFDAIGRGILRVEIGSALPLSKAAEAHRALEGRGTTGSTILIPDAQSGDR